MLGKKSKFQNYNVGIDIGTHTARAVVTSIPEEEGRLPEILAVAASNSRGLRNGYITNMESAKETLSHLLQQLKANSEIEVKRANISIGGISVSSTITSGEAIVTRADTIIMKEDINKAIEDATKKIDITNREILHTIPLSYKIDGKELPGRLIGMRGMRIEIKVLFIICLSQHLNDLLDLCADFEIEVNHVVASPIAASTVALNDYQKESGCMLANIGAETLSLIVYENGLPISLQVLPYGGSNFTKDIALGLKVDMEEAEQIKTGRGHGTYSERKLSEIVEARLRDIFELLEKHLKKIGRSALLPAGIIITGGGSHITQIETLARSHLRLPARIGIPEHLLSMKPRIRDVSWIVAYGLCAYTETDEFGDTGKKPRQTSAFNKKLKSFFHDLMP